MKPPNATLLLALALIPVLALPAARADVKIQTLTHFSGVVGGIGESNGHSVEYYQGDKYRSDNASKLTGVGGAIQRWYTHDSNGSESVTIYRVDRNRMYDLDPHEKTYTESPIYTPPQPGQTPGQSSSSSSGSSPSGQSASSGQSDKLVTRSTFRVEDTGQTRVINGFSTREYLVTWDLETEDTTTHNVGKSLVIIDLWNTEDARLKAVSHAEDVYNRAYGRLMRMPTPAQLAGEPEFQKLALLSGGQFKQLAATLGKIKGYPVVTDVKWDVACDNTYTNSGCPSDTGSQSQNQSQSSDSSGGGLGGLLGGFLAHKVEEKAQEKAMGEAESSMQDTNGMYIVMSFHIEVQAVDTVHLPVSVFEVPAGYSRG